MKELLSKEHYCYNTNTLLIKSSAYHPSCLFLQENNDLLLKNLNLQQIERGSGSSHDEPPPPRLLSTPGRWKLHIPPRITAAPSRSWKFITAPSSLLNKGVPGKMQKMLQTRALRTFCNDKRRAEGFFHV